VLLYAGMVELVDTLKKIWVSFPKVLVIIFIIIERKIKVVIKMRTDILERKNEILKWIEEE
jgi:hypothetical protein